MSQNATNDRVESLLVAADGHTRHGSSQKALQSLRQASALDPDNEKVRAALSQLQLSSRAEDDIVDLITQYDSSPRDQILSALLQALSRNNTLTEVDAAQYLQIILRNDCSQHAWSDIIVKLVNGHAQARKAVAHHISAQPDKIIELCLRSSDAASKAAHQVLFDDAAWSSKKIQLSSQLAVYLELAALTDPPENTRRSTELMLRQLIMSPVAVAESTDESIFKRLFALLDINESQQIRGQALLAISKLLEAKGEEGESILVQVVVCYATCTDVDVQVLAFAVVAALFPVIPAVCARLVLTEGFIPGLLPLLQTSKVSEVGTRTTSMQRVILELLSAACIDKTCRVTISKHCQTHLTDMVSHGLQELSLLAALTLTKLSVDNADSAVLRKVMQAALESTSSTAVLAIEGLAYASLRPTVKEQICKNAGLLRRLMNGLGDGVNALSILTILDNLTSYRPVRSEEQKKMSQLKAYANSSKPMPDDPLNNDGMVSARCKALIDVRVVAAISASLKELRSLATLSLVGKVINSLAREQKHRTGIVREGGLSSLLQIDARLESLAPKDSTSARRIVAHALARVLISVNPELVFSSSNPVTTAVSTILPLLQPDPEQEERDLLPTFEALLALTNLASMNDGSACDLILRKGWETLEDQLLLSSITLVQRASTELVCNLMLSPAGVAKFADGSDQAGRRLHILLALADVDDIPTRRAAGGALAMLTEWDAAVTALMKIPRGIKILLSLCADTHDDIKHRGFICVLNCMSIPEDTGKMAMEKVKAANGIAIAVDAVKSTKSSDVLSAGADLIKILT